MNKLYTITLLLIMGLQVKAQQVPNGNFEQWQYNPTSFTMEPVGWQTLNMGIYGDSCVRKYKPAHGGNFACGLQTSFILSTFAIPGVLTTTFPITSKPSNLIGYIKGNLALDDTTVLVIEFSKDTNVIGDGLFYLTQSQNNYIKFVTPIDFFGAGNPDSCTIRIWGGGTAIDDTLTSIAIDDLSFEYPVNVKNIFSTSDLMQVYPNPTNDVLNIQYDGAYESVVIYNATGQMIANFKNEAIIHLDNLNGGIYYLQLLDANHQCLAGKSFIKN